MEHRMSCIEGSETYVEPATDLETSCALLCQPSYLPIQVKMDECRQFCPDSFLCLLEYQQTLQEHSTEVMKNLIKAEESGSKSYLVVLFSLIMIAFVIFLVLMLVYICVCWKQSCMPITKLQEFFRRNVPDVCQHPEEDTHRELAGQELLGQAQQPSPPQLRLINETESTNIDNNAGIKVSREKPHRDFEEEGHSVSNITLFHQSLPRDSWLDNTLSVIPLNQLQHTVNPNSQVVGLLNSDTNGTPADTEDEPMSPVCLDQDEELLTRLKTVSYSNLDNEEHMPLEVSNN